MDTTSELDALNTKVSADDIPGRMPLLNSHHRPCCRVCLECDRLPQFLFFTIHPRHRLGTKRHAVCGRICYGDLPRCVIWEIA